MAKLYIFGTGGQSKIVTDIALSMGIEIGGYIAEENIDSFLGYKAYKSVQDIPNYLNQDYFVGIGYNDSRKKVAEENSGLNFINIIHPTAIISKSVTMGVGNLFMPYSVVNTETKIGDHNIFNTSAVVEHECVVGSYNHLSVKSVMLGTVTIGDGVFVGASSTIKNNLTVCSNVTIGMCAGVVKDINEKGVYVGVPAKLLKK